jgi:tetratricopeptide (TPR) repeat protein
MEIKCSVCGITASDGQVFAQEPVPFRSARTYCPNCHARFHRRFFQAGLVLDVAMGVIGLVLVWANSDSRLGHCALNLFLLQLFLVLATVPHELAHAFAARACGLRVEKIVLGFGPAVLAGRWVGFDVEVKQIPYGGCTQAEADGARGKLWRFLCFHAAGPAMSIALAWVALAAAGPSRTASLDLSVAVSPWWLFGISSVTIAVHHLFPHVRSTPFGRVASDGLALCQLVFLRRLPFVPQAKDPPPIQHINFARRTARGFNVAVFGMGAVAGVGCAVLVARAAVSAGGNAILWTAAVLFLLLGITFAWGAVWTHRKPWQSAAPPDFSALKRHKEVIEAFRIEVNGRSFWPPNLNYDQVLAQLEQLKKSGQIANAEAFLDEAIRWAPDNVALLGWKGLVLTWAGRNDAAVTQFKDVLDNDDLGLSIRVTFLAEHIKALLRLGERQAAWVLCGEYLDEPGLLQEKLYLLDTLAALPVEEGLAHLVPDADHWSAQALAMQPENLSVKATRAAVLAEQGRWDEARPLLSEVHSRSEIQPDKALVAYYLALDARQLGEPKAAARLFRQARLLAAAPWLIGRLDAESAPKAA